MRIWVVLLCHVALPIVTCWYPSSRRASLEGPRWPHPCTLAGATGRLSSTGTLEQNTYTWHSPKGSLRTARFFPWQFRASGVRIKYHEWQLKAFTHESSALSPRTSVLPHSIIGHATHQVQPSLKGKRVRTDLFMKGVSENLWPYLLDYRD